MPHRAVPFPALKKPGLEPATYFILFLLLLK